MKEKSTGAAIEVDNGIKVNVVMALLLNGE
jgi:hypothetical protein